MKRIVLAIAVITLTSFLLQVPRGSTLTPAEYRVSGSLSGTWRREARSCGGSSFLATVHVTGDVAPFGSSTVGYAFCGNDSTHLIEPLGFTLTAPDGTVTGVGTGSGFEGSEPPFAVTAGTGRYAGITGTITFSPDYGVPVVHLTASGTVSFGPPFPTTRDDCKHEGWRNVVNDQGQPFKNQGQCINFVK